MKFENSEQVISCPLLSSNEESKVTLADSSSTSQFQKQDQRLGSWTRNLTFRGSVLPVLAIILNSNPAIELPKDVQSFEVRTIAINLSEPNGPDLDWTQEEILDTYSRLKHFEEDWNAPGMELYDEM